MNKSIIAVIVLVIVGLYWLIAHTAPLPFNHEQFGLYQHNIHRIIGVVFLIVAGLVWWKWKDK
jgi:type IV secretory pathway VirB2 component (pilin)